MLTALSLARHGALYGAIAQHALGSEWYWVVRDEREGYVRCARSQYGFCCSKCTECRHDHLLTFSYLSDYSCTILEMTDLLVQRAVVALPASHTVRGTANVAALGCSRLRYSGMMHEKAWISFSQRPVVADKNVR